VGVSSNETLQNSSISRSFLMVMSYLAEFFLATYLTGFTQHISSCLGYIFYCSYYVSHHAQTTYLAILVINQLNV